MNRIGKAFENKKALITFITGGDPDIETTEKLILAMEEAGADIIEIGIPFSDPIAEGPVILSADERALAAGCTVDRLFEMVARVRARSQIPILFMTYINPVFVYGYEKFFARCGACGIDGVIIPDLPFEERDEAAGPCEENGLALISMISPSSNERIAMIAKDAKGFLYCVSSLGVTGVRSEIKTDVSDMVRRARDVSDVPCAVGFGISTPEQARRMASVSDGVIVGSAIVQLIAEYGRDCVPHVKQFVSGMKNALNSLDRGNE